MSRPKPPQPTDIWEDEDGKVWYEYSAHDIIAWEMSKMMRSFDKERMNWKPDPSSPELKVLKDLNR